MSEVTNFAGASNIFLEFLEVAVHNILFCRKLYPETIFTLKRKFGVSVYVSVYPKLNQYITECLKALQELIKLKKLRQVAVVFYDEASSPIEKFIFNILTLKTDIVEEDIPKTDDPYFIKLQEAMRSFLLKISMCETSLRDLPNNCTFQILAYTTETAMFSLFENPVSQDFPWIEHDDEEVRNVSIVPLNCLKSDLLQVEMYVECSSS